MCKVIISVPRIYSQPICERTTFPSTQTLGVRAIYMKKGFIDFKTKFNVQNLCEWIFYSFGKYEKKKTN